jgi:hypothetical protein
MTVPERRAGVAGVVGACHATGGAELREAAAASVADNSGGYMNARNRSPGASVTDRGLRPKSANRASYLWCTGNVKMRANGT